MAPSRAMKRLGGCLAYPLALYGMARLVGDVLAALIWAGH